MVAGMKLSVLRCSLLALPPGAASRHSIKLMSGTGDDASALSSAWAYVASSNGNTAA